MITLKGLTPTQKVICQQLWEMDDIDKVNTFVAIGGPEVAALRDLMIAEVLDQRMDIQQETVDFLSKF